MAYALLTAPIDISDRSGSTLNSYLAKILKLNSSALSKTYLCSISMFTSKLGITADINTRFVFGMCSSLESKQ